MGPDLADNRAMTVKVAAFDVYNTLVRWPDDRVTSLDIQRLLDRYGIPTSYQAIEAARQAVFSLDAPKRAIHGYVDFLALQFDRMGLRISLDLIESIAAMQESRNDMVLFPDALDAVQAARSAGKVTCAFTTLPRFMLGRAGDEVIPLLDHYFDNSTVGLPKGDPRFYKRITKTLGVEAASILCVGDDPICDCALPAEAGWQPILLDRTGNLAEQEAGQRATIGSLSQIERFLIKASDP